MVISLAAYLVILAAIAGERVGELAIAARNGRRALAQGAIETGRAQYRAMVALHALFLPCAALEAVVLRRSFPGALGWIALAGAVLAQGLRYWCVTSLGPRWNTRIIVMPGAAPVTTGPYRFLRHPNYLAVTIEILCVPLIRGCWLTAAVFSALNAILLTARIRAEEAALGPRYADAFADRFRLLPSPRHGLRRGARDPAHS